MLSWNGLGLMAGLTLLGMDAARDRDRTGYSFSPGPRGAVRKRRAGKPGQGARRQLRLQRRRNQKRRQRA